MHCWYVKKRYQIDHEERREILGIDIVLEDTSAQVDSDSPLPHIIIQCQVNEISTNYIYLEPISREELDKLRAEHDDALH